jgi:hypothetical protein
MRRRGIWSGIVRRKGGWTTRGRCCSALRDVSGVLVDGNYGVREEFGRCYKPGSGSGFRGVFKAQ